MTEYSRSGHPIMRVSRAHVVRVDKLLEHHRVVYLLEQPRVDTLLLVVGGDLLLYDGRVVTNSTLFEEIHYSMMVE